MRRSTSTVMPRRTLLGRTAALGSGMAAMALAACGGGDKRGASQQGAALPTALPAETAKVQRGGSLAVEWLTTNSLWDPYRVSTGVVQHYSGIFETLVTSHPKTLELEPLLIESWEEVEVGARYVLHVRKGATWENKAPTNGRAFDAEDVVYNLKYASGLSDPSKAAQIVRSSWYRGLQSVTAIDKSTVEMKLSPANGAILAAMADMRQFAIPREIPDQMPFNDYAKFPSVGPFIIREYRDGETASYERNPNYWNKELPYLDRGSIKWFGDASSAIAALLSGEIQEFRLNSGKADIDQIQKSGKPVSFYPFQFRAHGVMYINGDRYPDPRVWKALHYAFDRATACDAVLGKGLWDYCGPLERVLPGASPSDVVAKLPGYNPATKEADRKEAVAMLKAAGYPDGEGLAFEVLQGAAFGSQFDINVYFQADMKQVFPKMKVDIRPAPDTASYQRAIGSREFQMMGGYSIYEALDSRLAAENWKTKGTRNYGMYSNPQVDQLVDKAYAQPFQEALKTVQEIDKILLNASPLIVPNGLYEGVFASNKVKGLTDRLGPGSGGQYNETSKSRKFVWLEQ
jgi:ABC-type transport system substrate-binding protein